MLASVKSLRSGLMFVGNARNPAKYRVSIKRFHSRDGMEPWNPRMEPFIGTLYLAGFLALPANMRLVLRDLSMASTLDKLT
jgi:hypothetical protein